MLSSAKKILSEAQNQKYAIGHFNTSDLEITQAIVIAAQKERAPVIIATTPKAITYAGLEPISSIIKNIAYHAKVPVIMHLDHGKDIKMAWQCLKVGYNSIMIDASNYKLKKNILITKKVVEMAHQFGAIVEGEIGVVKGGVFGKGKGVFTDPDEAKYYVEQTDIDSLAISIGNAHGGLQPNEFLNFELLKKIQDNIEIPLVLHGASGTPEIQIRKSISLGVCKINIDTDIRLAFRNSINLFIKKHPDVYDPREIMASAMEAVEKIVRQKIKLFGSSNKI